MTKTKKTSYTSEFFRPFKNLLAGFVFLCGLAACSDDTLIGPAGSIKSYPSKGDLLTVFKFDGSSFFDDKTKEWQLQVRWDVNSDGTWETDFSIFKVYAYRYSSEGQYQVTCECLDQDGNIGSAKAIVEVQPVFRDSLIIDSRDNQVYKVVLLNDRWWMAQGLMAGTPLSDTGDPQNNGEIEYFVNPHDPDLQFGGYYLWNEATLYGQDTVFGICPAGWRLPTRADVVKLQNITSFRTNLDEFFGPGGSLGLNLYLTGSYIRFARLFNNHRKAGEFWLTDGSKPARYRTWANFSTSYFPGVFYEANVETADRVNWNFDWGLFSYDQVALPVRCVKNE